MIKSDQRFPFDVDLTLTPFATLDEEQQMLVWRMRNHPDVAKWMTTGGDISLESHLAFMRRQKNDPKNLNYLAYDSRGPLGVVSLHRLDVVASTAYLGIYRNPFRSEAGLGNRLMTAICAVAFGEIGLETFRLEVARDNHAAIALYKRVGFVAEGEPEAWCSDLLIMIRDRSDWTHRKEASLG